MIWKLKGLPILLALFTMLCRFLIHKSLYQRLHIFPTYPLLAIVHNQYDWARHFIRSIEIPESSELYKDVKEWLHKNHPHDEDPCLEARVEGTDRGAIVYSPSFPSTKFFNRNGKQYAIDWVRRRDGDEPTNTLRISTGIWNGDALPSLLRHIHDSSNEGSRISVYQGLVRYQVFCWKRGSPKGYRSLSSIVMDHLIKQSFVNDIEDFLRPETRRKYSRQGSPYRRGYLLAGPPGTGKSSLCVALAGFTRLNIYTILFSDKLDENGLNTLFQELPERCIVLLEDFDVTGLQISRHPESGSDRSGKSRLSLSCLLNVFDGVAAHEGRILILTANDAGKLDHSLIRPGRIDKTIHFGYANQQLAQEMFLTFYFEIPHGIFIGQPDKNQTIHPVTQPTLSNWKSDDIVALSCLFAEYYPLSECTTSDIQLYLQGYWSCPGAAVANLFEGSNDSRIELDTQLATLGTSKSLIAINKKPYMAHVTLYIRAPSGELFLQKPSCSDCHHEGCEDASWNPPQGTIQVQDATLDAAVNREVSRLTSLQPTYMQIHRYAIHDNTQIQDSQLGSVNFKVIVHVHERQHNDCHSLKQEKGDAELQWVSGADILYTRVDSFARDMLG
jgi:chaperone BCS1